MKLQINIALLAALSVLMVGAGASFAAQSAQPKGQEGAGVTGKAERDLVQIRKETRPDGTRTAVLTNTSSRSLFYTAFAKGNPIELIEKQQKGEWVPARYLRCGTGLQHFELKPGESVSVTISAYKPESSQKIRHAVAFHDNSTGEGTPVRVTVEEITGASKA